MQPDCSRGSRSKIVGGRTSGCLWTTDTQILFQTEKHVCQFMVFPWAHQTTRTRSPRDYETREMKRRCTASGATMYGNEH